MLDDVGVLKKYWAFAVSLVVDLKNRTPTRSVVGKTPYDAWHGRKPFLKHLRVFGSLAFVQDLTEKLKKRDYGATPGKVVWYRISIMQYFVYNPLAKMLRHSRDVVCREGKRYTAPNAADEAIINEHFTVMSSWKPKPTPQRSDQQNVKRRCFWTTMHVRSLRRQRL
jgi:hypothetical protein